jgi:hypothetical protein
MSGASKRARECVGWVAAVWLGGASGCVEVPEPLELELELAEEDDAFLAPPAPSAERLFAASREHDYVTWPLSRDPRMASVGSREVRTYPLWPTPIDEPCPAVMFGSWEPQLDAGPMFERVTARLATIADLRLKVAPSEIVLLRDHIDVPGLRLVAASDTDAGCMMGWSHTHCFVDPDDVYCPDGTDDELERLVRHHGLRPTSLTSAGWLELSAVMVGAEHIVIEPKLVRECTIIKDVEALAPAVELEESRVTVRFTAITEGHGFDHTVVVTADGAVTTETDERWHMPSDEDVWGSVASEAGAG